MKNGEVFDTDASGELVVNNSVEGGSDDASDRDFKGFHRVVGLKTILADCVTVRPESRWSTAGEYPPCNWITAPGNNQGGSEGSRARNAR